MIGHFYSASPASLTVHFAGTYALSLSVCSNNKQNIVTSLFHNNAIIWSRNVVTQTITCVNTQLIQTMSVGDQVSVHVSTTDRGFGLYSGDVTLEAALVHP